MQTAKNHVCVSYYRPKISYETIHVARGLYFAKYLFYDNVYSPSSYCALQPIVYEGQDKNPEMCRVLLTHEVMCR